MNKKLLATALAAVMTLSMLAGCGNGGGDTKPSASGGAAQGEGGGASGDTIKVGLLAPLTGDVAQYGVAVRNGAKMYVDELNAAGGINGKQIELIEYDEEGDEAKAVTGYNFLKDKGITALLGDVTTSPTLAVVPEANADNMPMISASATAASVTVNEDTNEVFSNMFRSCFTDPFQGEKMAGFAQEHLNAKTAAIIYNTGSDYSTGCKEFFESTAKDLGIEIVAVEGYADKSVDFQSQLTNIASKKPDVLFAPDYYETMALIASQAKSAGVESTLLGVDGWDTVLNVVEDTALLEGAYYCSGYSPEDDSEMLQKFLADYKAKYNEDPNMFAAQAYDAAHILCDALAKAEEAGLEAGSAEYMQAVIDAMKATDKEFVTGSITFNDTNDPQKEAVINNIKGGKAEYWGKY